MSAVDRFDQRFTGLLEDLGAAQPVDDVADGGVVAELIADAVHDAAGERAVQAQPDRPGQQ